MTNIIHTPSLLGVIALSSVRNRNSEVTNQLAVDSADIAGAHREMVARFARYYTE